MADRDPRTVGGLIARRRHQLGWSQVELADRLGVSPSTVANWERGAAYPKKKLGKVEEVLGISFDGPEPDPIAERIKAAFINAGYSEERADYLTYVVRGVADGTLTVTMRPQPGEGGQEPGRAAG